MYPSIQFTCRFTQPFHSRAHQHANWYTVSPYILGTTIRGAILRYLIDQHCTVLDMLHADNPGYHKKCEEPCAIKPLFKPPTRFSFGHFHTGDCAKRRLRTRVGIDRQKFNAATGRLLSVEVWHGQFTFGVMYPSTELGPILRDAVEQIGRRSDDIAFGGLRSIGYGKYEVLDSEANPTETVRGGYSRYCFRFRTPYVLSEKAAGGEIPRDVLACQLRGTYEEAPFDFEVTEVTARPTSISHVRRWSDEKKTKLNRVVFDRGSELIVTFNRPIPTEHLALWQWGIGEWSDGGFGSFEAIPLDNRAEG